MRNTNEKTDGLMYDSEDFRRRYPLNRTIRFQLRPVGRTMEMIEKKDFLSDDRKRADAYPVVKSIVKDFHGTFITQCLENAAFDWGPLASATEEYHGAKDGSKSNLESAQKNMRKEVTAMFEKDGRFPKMFSEKLFSEILMKDQNIMMNERNKEALNAFNRFWVYFQGFHENMRNAYSDEEIATSVAHRIVNVNFPIFFENSKRIEELAVLYPDIIAAVEESFSVDVRRSFSIENFNEVLTQKGIDLYNTIIGGISKDKGRNIQGINSLINLKAQKEKDEKKIRKLGLAALKKQILGVRETMSHIPPAFESDAELLESVRLFYDDLNEHDVFNRAVELLSGCLNNPSDTVYIRGRRLRFVSSKICGEWNELGDHLLTYYQNVLYSGKKNAFKEAEKRMRVNESKKSEGFPLSDIFHAIEYSESEAEFGSYVRNLVETVGGIDERYRRIAFGMPVEDKNGNQIEELKDFMDSVHRVFELLNPFRVSEDLPRDGSFYPEFDALHEKLFPIIPLYNRVRNYVTKKKFNTHKMKLNFRNSTLAAGWDKNKEYDNTSIILLRDGKYYLGIMDPQMRKKLNFEKGESPSGQYYRKMVYKLLPDPKKMLPKVFFSEKGLKKYNPPEHILEGYEKGKHKKGEHFDKGFLHELIDFFKDSISKNPDWSVFRFEFSPTSEYEDTGQFYREVERKGYRIEFADIPLERIEEYVNEGMLFLFQIYNKDFSEHAKGAKNMHTLYWEAAFSEENLADVVIRLNGDAELFYRERSDIPRIVHKKGEMLVNRLDVNKNPIPDRIHHEIYLYENGRCKELSKEAREYRKNAIVFENRYEIVKDRRYHVDQMYFHVPLTLNFGCVPSNDINRTVIERAAADKDLKIIGLDRGERNLIYYSMIDRNGKILEQGSLNVIDGIDYQEKLIQREKERNESRKSWKSVEKIKSLKEGYLSKVVHEISKMVIENNALLVMENLNSGFKRGRFKFERQIYQKFEDMLVDKLNYLVFKDREGDIPGTVRNAYQLTAPTDSASNKKRSGNDKKQSGVLFYVPASYTSAIDPTTGFVNLFRTSGINTVQKIRDFLSRFESVFYDKGTDSFAFVFDYSKFDTSVKMDPGNRWTVYTRGTRIRFNRSERRPVDIDPTNIMKELLSDCGIPFQYGKDILPEILDSGSNVPSGVFYAFVNTLSLRNTNHEKDAILSPVKNSDGGFYDSERASEDQPVDADANGAYHIALKGELMLRMIEETCESGKKQKVPYVDNRSWLDFVQNRWRNVG